MLSNTPLPKRPPIRRTPATINRVTHNETRNQTATSAHAITNRPSVTLARLLVSRTPKASARPRARELPLPQYHLPVHHHVLDPTDVWCGFSKVARSITVAGLKTVMSAYIPDRTRPRSVRPTRCAASDVIFRTANSSGNSFRSRE